MSAKPIPKPSEKTVYFICLVVMLAFIAGMALADAIGIGYYLVKHRKETL